MTSNRAAHEKETSSPSNSRNSRQSVNVTRRRFLATSAAGVAGLGALGSAGSAAADTGEHTLEIQGTGERTSYSFTVGGNLSGERLTGEDEIIARSAHGAVKSGRDIYTFDGPLYSFDFDRSGAVDVTLDGESAHVGRRPDHTLLIEGFGPTTSYSFAASGRVKHSDAYGADINETEKINAYGASGAVQGGKDAFTYDGELYSFDFDRDGEVRVTIDGKAAHVGRRPDRTITVVGRGKYAEYDVVIDGSIREVIDSESSQDTVTGNTFSGAVSGFGHDKFTCDGDIAWTRHNNDNAPAVFSNRRQIL